MARGKYTNKKKKKYAPRRGTRRRHRANNTNMLGFVSGMPKVRRAHLRYADTIDLTSTVGSMAAYRFRATSLFDPDQSGTGHQPMGFDQWAQLYNHYVVVGAKISIKSLSGQSGSSISSICGCYISDDTTFPYSTSDGFIEAKRGAWRTMTHQRNTVSFYVKFSTKKFFNITDVKDNVTRVGAAVGANPTEEAYFNVWFQDLDGTTSATGRFQICIDYIADFSEPKDLVQS